MYTSDVPNVYDICNVGNGLDPPLSYICIRFIFYVSCSMFSLLGQGEVKRFCDMLQDMKKKDRPVNSLMGHSASVTNVSWSSDENFLASADVGGMVIIWTRKK